MAAFTTVDNPLLHFNTVLYTGNGTTQAITGVGFAPDMVCIKNRDAAWQFVNWDSMVGAGDDEELSWSATNPRGGPDAYSYGQLSAFGADGFTVAKGGSAGTPQFTNTSGTDYAAWCWKAGTTTGIDTTGATITPTEYTFNAAGGYSIIRYTGTGVNATLPHGLGVKPALIWIKKESAGATDWQMGNDAVGWTKYATSNTTAAFSTNSGAWNDTDPTSVLFTIGTNGECNTSTSTYIAYCFATLQGYMKAGIYEGNGNADGAYIYTGFKPSWVLLHATVDTGYSWPLYDNKRTGMNGPNPYGNNYFLEEASDAEDPTIAIDLVANGFKFKSSSGHVNGSRAYCYFAMAEMPFVSSNGIPAPAR